MVYIATEEKNFEQWDFITGSYYEDMSISVSRYYHLDKLNSMHPIKVALKDPESDRWTKWKAFPGDLWTTIKNQYGNGTYYLNAAIDVHRSMLPNEIIIESDYPTYEENYEATRVIGKIIEDKGFTPHYYFSGNKSIHIHVFFDWDCLKELDPIIQRNLKKMFRGSKTRFKKKFIAWLREKMISCWDTEAKEFDKDLIRGTHLIRAELSRNKKGYKTFMGYTTKDFSFVPLICNESNRIYPKLGDVRLSKPNNIEEIIEDFIDDFERKQKKKAKMNKSLGNWVDKDKKDLKNCVKAILSDDFKSVRDGTKRAMFILINELKKAYGKEQTRTIVNDWNNRMGFDINQEKIDYRIKSDKEYTLTCKYIHSFLSGLGIDVSGYCNHKV